MRSKVAPLIDCYDHFKKHLKDFVEVFVEYYGEEKRQEIEDAFSRVIPLAYNSPESLKTLLFQYSKELTDDITSEYSYLIPPGLTGNDLFNNESFQYEINIPIYQYWQFLREYQKDPKSEELERLFNRIKYLLLKLNPNITLDRFKDYLERPEIIALNNYASKIPEMYEEYKKRISGFQPQIEEVKYCSKIKEELNKKYYLRLVNDNLDLLSQRDIEELKKYALSSNNYLDATSKMYKLFGSIISNNSYSIEAFSIDADEKLGDDTKPSWIKDIIKSQRIEFFKAMGIDLGNNYDDYLENEEVKKIWPSHERVEKFIESKNKHLNDFNIEYRSKIPSYIRSRKEIESHDLVDQNDCYDVTIYSDWSSPAMVCPNLVKTNDGYHLVFPLVVNCNYPTGTIDHFIVHELNHILELSIKELSLPYYELFCGWDLIEETITKKDENVDTLEDHKKTRPYEKYSEIINEMIARDISQIMINKKMFIFDNEDNKSIAGATYALYFFLLSDVFKEFKPEIIESRHNGHIEIIWNKVGKENFDALNNLIKECISIFDNGFKIMNTLSAIKDNKETEDTILLKDFIKRRNEILKKMRLHSALQNNEVVESQPETKK